MRHPRARPIAGFTIVEVMMAATILVVAFVGMIQAVTIGSEMMATARRQTLANQIITHEVEALRLKSWPEISVLSSISEGVYSATPPLEESITHAGVVFLFSREVKSPNAELREVTVVVRWPEDRKYTRQMTAYYGRYGLSLTSQR